MNKKIEVCALLFLLSLTLTALAGHLILGWGDAGAIEISAPDGDQSLLRSTTTDINWVTMRERTGGAEISLPEVTADLVQLEAYKFFRKLVDEANRA
jgi:hypothetical protein